MAQTVININVRNMATSADINRFAANLRAVLKELLGREPSIRINDTSHVSTMDAHNFFNQPGK